MLTLLLLLVAFRSLLLDGCAWQATAIAQIVGQQIRSGPASTSASYCALSAVAFTEALVRGCASFTPCSTHDHRVTPPPCCQCFGFASVLSLLVLFLLLAPSTAPRLCCFAVCLQQACTSPKSAPFTSIAGPQTRSRSACVLYACVCVCACVYE